MDILHSNWLIQMLKKAGNTPQKRLLSLFDILNDWTEAPGVNIQLNQQANINDANLLKTYLSLEAAKARAALPEMLATQLYIMALSATHEKLLGHNTSALIHAKSAAEALITAQTKKEIYISRRSIYAIAASFIGTIIIASSLWLANKPVMQQPTLSTAMNNIDSQQLPIYNLMATPQSTAELVTKIEQMRNGNCRLIEAIQLPEKDQAVYFKNIIAGQISTNPDEQIIVRKLLEQIQCNYSPMLMKKST